MKNISKLLCAALCLVLCVGMFAGCAAQDNDLAKIKAAGKIVWGTNAEFPPFEMKDSSGNVIGADADIAAAIAEELGVELVVEDILFDSLPAALASGQIDFIAAGFTKNEERAQKMDFTKDYYSAVQVVVYNVNNAAPADEAELEGKKIGVQTGTTGDLFFASEIEGADVQRYDNMTLAVQDLANGTLDYVIGDNLTIGMILEQIDGVAIAEDIVYEAELYAIAVDKGESELLEVINKVLDDMIANGEIEASVNKYQS